MNQSVWGPVRQEMHDLLQAHPDDVPAVVDQLTELQEVLDHVPPLLQENPLCDFNRLYLQITEGLLDRLYAGGFADPAFLSRLDVEFAARYFDALRAWSNASTHCPQVWAALFRRVPGPDSLTVPSACAGLNAHVNFDLPFALVTTFDHLGRDPIDDSDQHHDYLAFNEIFASSVPGCLDKWQLLVDTMSGTFDEGFPGEPTDYGRNVPWRNAQKLWSMRHDMAATDKERAHLDRVTADLGRLLLSPMGTFLQ